MPYITAPPRARFIDRAAFFFEYLVIAGLGFLLVLYNSPTQRIILGVEVMTVHGIAMMLFALIASVGALIDHYQIEYAAIWFNIAAVMGTAGWAYTWASSNDGTFASLIMPLSLIYIALNLFRRWNYLSTIADTNRTLYAVRKV